MSTDPWKTRVDSGDWPAITAELDTCGGALLPRLLTAAETEQIRGLYEKPSTSAARSTWAGTGSGRYPNGRSGST